MNTLARIWRALFRIGNLRAWGLLLAGPVVTILAVYLSEVLRHPVPDALMKTQLNFQGWALLAALALLGIVVTALAAARVTVKGPAGTEFNADATEKWNV